MNDREKELGIFQLALGLTEEWYLENTEFKNGELHMYVAFKKGTKWKNEDDELVTAYDTVKRTWRHLNFFEYRAFIHAKVPRINNNAGKPKTVSVPWANSQVGFTLKFELMVLSFLKDMSAYKVAKKVGIDNHTVFNIAKKYVDTELSKQDLSLLKKFAIDEKHIGKNGYISPVVDQEKKSVVFIANGKDSNTLTQFQQYLIQKKGLIANILLITSDMSKAFAKGIREIFTNALHIVDVFHVIKLFNETLNKIKNIEMRDNAILNNSKYALLKNQENLTQRQKEKLNNIIENEFLKTSQVYKLKQELVAMFKNQTITPEEAKLSLTSIIERGFDLNIPLLNKTLKSIRRNTDKIIAYFEQRYTNGISESINSKIDHLISRGRGYRNLENLKTMIYFTCGNLNIDTSFSF